MLLSGNECGKNDGNENLKGSIPSTDYDTLETSGECGIFQILR
jgi:hypothetical protein